MRSSVVASFFASGAAALSGAWGQCGGIGWSGSTSCVLGYRCTYQNDWYSQCVPGAAATTTTMTLKTSTTSSSAPTSTSSPSVGVRYVGRVNPATKELSWPGSGVSFAFTGTSATIGIASVSGSNSVELVIDGGAPIVITSFGAAISTPAGLSQGTHTVVLRKRSEPQYGSIFLGDITTNGAFAPVAVPTRQIEIIGDSISVGYGLDGTNPCPDSAAVQNNPKTYGAITAGILGADYSVVAWSGKGLVRNIAIGTTDTSPLIPQLYTRYGANDADNSYTFPSSWSPDAIVINLGTNDFNYIVWDANGQASPGRGTLNITTYTQGMVDFVRSIETHYPEAHFFLVSSTMLSDSWPTAADAQKTTQVNALKQAVKQLGPKAHFVDWPSQGSDVGCDYHPSAATHAAGAALLVQAIKSALGW
ncbi:SGNH hydrolase-type esterase domain containing protein [Rhypophila decipiens]